MRHVRLLRSSADQVTCDVSVGVDSKVAQRIPRPTRPVIGDARFLTPGEVLLLRARSPGNLRLAKRLETSAELWLCLQNDRDLWHAAQALRNAG